MGVETHAHKLPAPAASVPAALVPFAWSPTLAQNDWTWDAQHRKTSGGRGKNTITRAGYIADKVATARTPVGVLHALTPE